MNSYTNVTHRATDSAFFKKLTPSWKVLCVSRGGVQVANVKRVSTPRKRSEVYRFLAAINQKHQHEAVKKAIESNHLRESPVQVLLSGKQVILVYTIYSANPCTDTATYKFEEGDKQLLLALRLPINSRKIALIIVAALAALGLTTGVSLGVSKALQPVPVDNIFTSTHQIDELAMIGYHNKKHYFIKALPNRRQYTDHLNLIGNNKAFYLPIKHRNLLHRGQPAYSQDMSPDYQLLTSTTNSSDKEVIKAIINLFSEMEFMQHQHKNLSEKTIVYSPKLKRALLVNPGTTIGIDNANDKAMKIVLLNLLVPNWQAVVDKCNSDEKDLFAVVRKQYKEYFPEGQFVESGNPSKLNCLQQNII